MAAYTLCIETDLDKNERISELLFYRAHVCSDLRDYEQANTDYTDAPEKLDEYPNQDLTGDEFSLRVACHFNRANVRSYIELMDEAIEDYKYVETANNQFARELYYNWANTLFRFEKYEDAVEKYHNQIQRNPTHFDSFVNLALTNVVLGRWSQATRLYQEASEFGTLPIGNLDSVIKLNSELSAVDANDLRRVYLMTSSRVTFIVFSHPQLDEREISVSFQGIAGHSGNLPWGEMVGGNGLPGSPGLLIQLGGEM